MRIDEPVRRLVETLWNYHRLNHQLSKADAILVSCRHLSTETSDPQPFTIEKTRPDQDWVGTRRAKSFGI